MSRKTKKKIEREFKLQCRVEPEIKERFRTEAKLDGRDESSLLRKLVLDRIATSSK